MAFVSKVSVGVALSFVLGAPAVTFLSNTEESDSIIDRFVAPPEPLIRFQKVAQTQNQTQNQSATVVSQDVLANATKWEKFFNSDACHRELHAQWESGSSLYCGKSMYRYSASANLAYLETPKAGLANFAYLFRKMFQDSVTVNQSSLPEGVFTFTFVRDPLAQKIAVFAEAEKLSATSAASFREVGPEKQPSFLAADSMSTENGGSDRFYAYFNDMKAGMFDEQFAALKMHHSGSQIQVPCKKESQSEGDIEAALSLKFVGHLENVAADWNVIQELAKVPHELRTQAMLEYPVGMFSDFIYTRALEVQRSPQVTEYICKLFKSDYACLGYDMPPVCEGNSSTRSQ